MDINIENFWEEFSKPLKNYIKKHVNNEQDVDDILQNVFCKIYIGMNSLKDTEKIHAWVYTITRNTITDFYRAQRYEKSNIELYEGILKETDCESTTNNEIAQCIKSMINYLPESYKQAILLTDFQHLTQRELGERMGLSISGAKSRVQRARAKLKGMLMSCCLIEFDHFGNVIDYKHKSNDCKFC